MQISVGGAVTQALLYYVTPAQIAGVLPSATPAWKWTHHRYQRLPGERSGYDHSGSRASSESRPRCRPARPAFDAEWNARSATNAANPGEIIEFFGTGAGPVTGNEALSPTSFRISPTFPLKWILAASPLRSNIMAADRYPGLDQVQCGHSRWESPGAPLPMVVLSGSLVKYSLWSCPSRNRAAPPALGSSPRG